jgi:multimeric flavodoxin WrbA
MRLPGYGWPLRVRTATRPPWRAPRFRAIDTSSSISARATSATTPTTNAHADDDFLGLIEQAVEQPLWVIATPLYWYTMSAQAKTFLDRFSDLLDARKDLGHRLRGIRLAILCAGADDVAPGTFRAALRAHGAVLGHDVSWDATTPKLSEEAPMTPR